MREYRLMVFDDYSNRVLGEFTDPTMARTALKAARLKHWDEAWLEARTVPDWERVEELNA